MLLSKKKQDEQTWPQLNVRFLIGVQERLTRARSQRVQVKLGRMEVMREKGRMDEEVGHIQLVVLLGNLKHLTVDSDTGGCIMYNVLLDIPFIVNCFVQPFILTILIKTHSVNTWGECALTLYPL